VDNVSKVTIYRERNRCRSARQLSDIVEINEAMIKLRQITDRQQAKYSDFVQALKLL
jgi:uncharacterized coiled-coil protein SlyX